MRCLTLLAVLLLIPLAAGLEGFSSVFSSEGVCTNFQSLATISVKNTGDQTATYLVHVRPDGLASYQVQPDSFVLKPGQSGISNVIFLPKDKAFSLTYDIESNRGASQSFSQPLKAGFCSNVAMVVEDYSQSTCPCEEARYNFTITNTGAFTETYLLALDKYSDAAELSQNPVVIAPGKNARVQLRLKLDCSVSGPQILKFYANAQSSGIKSMVPLMYNINACYDSSLAASAPSQVCVGDSAKIPVVLRNDAHFSNNFSVGLEGPVWASLSTGLFTIGAGDQEAFYVNVTPGMAGSHVLILTSRSELGDNRQQISIPVEAKECYNLEVSIPESAVLCADMPNELEAQVANLGDSAAKIILSTSGNAFTESLETLTLDVQESRKLTINFNPTGEQLGISSVTIAAESEITAAQATASLNIVSKEECYRVQIDAPSKIRSYRGASEAITLNHVGAKSATYTANLTAPEGVTLEPSSLDLEPYQSSSFKLTIPENQTPGVYNVSIVFSTKDGQQYHTFMRLKVATSPSIWDSLYTFRFGILTGIAFLFLVFLVVRRMRKHPPRPGFWVGLVIVVVLLGTGLALLNPKWQLMRLLAGFISLYIRYILVGVILLIFILVGLSRMEK